MLKKLRLKFVLINMTIVTIMLCVIFGLLYHFTKLNLENESISMMRSIAENPFQIDRPGELNPNIKLPYFTLQLGETGDLIVTGGGYYDLSDERFLRNIIDIVLASPKQIGTLEEYNLRFCQIVSPAGQVLVFVDTSSEESTLKGLLLSSIGIGIISFLIFLFVSIFLSHWAVKPVDNAWRQQKQFISDASHELKTPLTVIMTNAQLLQESDYDEESRSLFSSHILSASKQMRRLLEQMLELARSDSAKNKQVFSQVHFSQLVSDAVLFFEPLFFDKGLTIEYTVSPNIMLSGDESRLRQLLDILLDNAQKYSSPNGNTIVYLKALPKNRLLLTVSNTGEPMTKEQLNNIFERFYRADEARSQDGSFGLGLSIAKHIVKQHQGKIWAESNAGKNIFYIDLPTI